MKYWIIRNGQSIGPFDISQLAQEHVTSATKVWRQGLTQWTAAINVPELAPHFAHAPRTAMQAQPQRQAALRTPSHQRAAIIVTVVIFIMFFDIFSPLSLLVSPCFYLLLPTSWLSIRTAAKARRHWLAGDSERAARLDDRTVLFITLNIVVALTLYPFHIVATLLM